MSKCNSFFEVDSSKIFLQVTSVKASEIGENGLKQLSIETNTGPLSNPVDCLIWCIGRDPNVEIGLQDTSIQLNSKGFIQVDE